MGFKISKTVSYLPNNKVTNDDLAKIVNTNDQWITKRTGIKTRYFADSETLNEMINKCVDKLLDTDIQGINVVIVSSMSNKNLAPNLSSSVANYLSLENCLCLDINSACSGFVYGLITTIGYLESRMFNKVLLITAEKMSDIIDMSDRKTNILFGDAISCSVVEYRNKDNLICNYQKTLLTKNELYINDAGYLSMLGQDVFKFAYRAICQCIDYTLEENQIAIEDIDYFLLHQANIRIINKVMKKYQIDTDKMLINIERVANTSSSSIGLLLAENEIKEDKTVFMCGFGAGLSFGSLLYKS